MAKKKAKKKSTKKKAKKAKKSEAEQIAEAVAQSVQELEEMEPVDLDPVDLAVPDPLGYDPENGYEEIEQDDPNAVMARGPGAPSAAERRKLAQRGLLRRYDPNDLMPQMPGVDVAPLTPAQRKDPRLTNRPNARAQRRRNAIYARRAAMGLPTTRPVYERDGTPTGAKTSDC